MKLYIICLNTSIHKWQAQTNPDLYLLYFISYKTASIRSRKITAQNSNQLVREMELLSCYISPELPPTDVWGKWMLSSERCKIHLRAPRLTSKLTSLPSEMKYSSMSPNVQIGIRNLKVRIIINLMLNNKN